MNNLQELLDRTSHSTKIKTRGEDEPALILVFLNLLTSKNDKKYSQAIGYLTKILNILKMNYYDMNNDRCMFSVEKKIKDINIEYSGSALTSIHIIDQSKGVFIRVHSSRIDDECSFEFRKCKKLPIKDPVRDPAVYGIYLSRGSFGGSFSIKYTRN